MSQQQMCLLLHRTCGSRSTWSSKHCFTERTCLVTPAFWYKVEKILKKKEEKQQKTEPESKNEMNNSNNSNNINKTLRKQEHGPVRCPPTPSSKIKVFLHWRGEKSQRAESSLFAQPLYNFLTPSSGCRLQICQKQKKTICFFSQCVVVLSYKVVVQPSSVLVGVYVRMSYRYYKVVS